MAKRKPSAIAKEVDALLDKGQARRLSQMNGIERLLAMRLLLELSDQLQEGEDGRITSRKGYASLAKTIDAVFDAIEAREFADMGKSLVGDIKGVLKFNADYFEALDLRRKSEFKAIRSEVDARMRQRLGITSEDGIAGGGYLTQLFATSPARDEIKKMVAKQVAAGVPMRKLKRAIEQKVAGTKEAAGVLERHLGGFLLDTYNVADSVTNAQFAQRLGLRYFIYSGGLIETSRAFCRKHNNKVFTTEEAERDWPVDPTLPRTKAEKDAGGAPGDYVPLEDRGRWNCRHRILYIPKEEAVRRRPDLAGT